MKTKKGKVRALYTHCNFCWQGMVIYLLNAEKTVKTEIGRNCKCGREAMSERMLLC